MNPVTTGNGDRVRRLAPASRWGGLPTRLLTGPPGEILAALPCFDKVPSESLGLGANQNHRMVVRNGDGMPPVPVALVSGSYRLIQHGDVLREALDFVREIPDAEVPRMIEASVTGNFERVMFAFDLGEGFAVSPDGHPVSLRLVCRNSVDGSSAVRAQLRWLRLVCSNGMTVGVTLGKLRLAHTPRADLREAFAPVREQLAIAAQDRERMTRWVVTKVGRDRLRRWADGPLAAAWQPLAAARVWHICTTGRDVEFVPPFEKLPPTQRAVRVVGDVPGVLAGAGNAYAVVQAMSWVASRRSDLDEAEDRQREIGGLVEKLLN